MKTYLAGFFVLLSFGVFSFLQVVAALENLGEGKSIITTEIDSVLTDNCLNDDNSIRCGTYKGINNTTEEGEKVVKNIIDVEDGNKINNHSGAMAELIRLIHIIINWTLGIVGLVALIYLIYNGFMMTTAHGDEKQFDKGKAGIKTAVIALAGIGLSWFIVSIIVRIITQLTKSD